jgi:hypothetical protein
MMNSVWLAPCLLGFAVLGSLEAAAAPAALYGKSVTVGWSETSEQRYVGELNFRLVPRSVHMSVYVSSAGRVFSRQTNSTSAGSGSTEQVAGQSGGERAARVPVFGGHDMTLFGPMPGGVRRVSVSFDQGFTSCTATAGLAIEPGKIAHGRSPVNGRPLEIAKVTAGPASCSVRDGNVFAGN